MWSDFPVWAVHLEKSQAGVDGPVKTYRLHHLVDGRDPARSDPAHLVRDLAPDIASAKHRLAARLRTSQTGQMTLSFALEVAQVSHVLSFHSKAFVCGVRFVLGNSTKPMPGLAFEPFL